MSVYTVHNNQGDLVFESDEVHEVAEFINTTVNSLRVALSNGNGVYVRGRKDVDKLTIRQDKDAKGKPGPKSVAWRYVCFYPDSEFPDQQTWGSEHEILFDEVFQLAACAYQKLARSTIEQRLASAEGLTMMIPVLKGFMYNRIDIKRFSPEAFDAVVDSWNKTELKRFEAERTAFLERLKKFQPRRK